MIKVDCKNYVNTIIGIFCRRRNCYFSTNGILRGCRKCDVSSKVTLMDKKKEKGENK